jgi:DNA-binding CsgD family transcriptional regulator/PAS domain-containing protein
MLPDSSSLSKLLEGLYEAAADPALWELTLKQVAAHCNATSAALLMHNSGSDLHSVARNWQVDPEGTRLYQKHYWSQDIWALRGATVAQREWVGTSEQLCSFAELSGSEYYNDFLQTLDIAHAAFALLLRSGEGESVLGIYRGPSGGAFEDSDLDLLRFLAPHIRQAFKLHLSIAELKRSSVGMAAALDMLDSGVVLIGVDAKIVLMNRAAETLLAKRDGLIATGAGLRAQIPRESERLEVLIRSATSISASRCLSPGGWLRISRSHAPSLQLQISPVRRFPLNLNTAVRTIVFITDPAQNHCPCFEALRAFFGLTAAEARVAILLGQGNTLRNISQALGVSGNTVKSQVASIHGKTGTSRQSQLVRLLMSLPPSGHNMP